MDNKNFPNLEDEIKYIIQNAINTKDFYQLNRDIQNTVNGALNEAKSALGLKPKRDQFTGGPGFDNSYSGSNQYNYNQNQQTGDPFNKTNTQNKRDNRQYDYYRDRETQRREERAAMDRARTERKLAKEYAKATQWKAQPYSAEKYPSLPVGRVAGILYTVFGSILQSLSGIAIVVVLIIGGVSHLFMQFATIALGILPAFAIGTVLSVRGSTLRGRIRRFNRYKMLFKDKTVYNIKDLSAQMGQKPKAITRDLRKMIGWGMFPEGHIDTQDSCIMLNQDSFRQYQDLQSRLKEQAQVQQETMQEAKSQESKSQQKKNQSEPMDEALVQAIANGKSYITQIRTVNDALPEEEISNKLDRLETVIDKIFVHVANHPEQLAEIKKFMDYYLPTTLKLVLAYQEFENQPIQGDNITTAKREIMDTLDTINRAFETLLDSLFEDAAMDVSTDISVLKTMLAQEGLTESAFNSKQASGGKKNEQ